MPAAWESAPLVGGDSAPAWQSAPLVGGSTRSAATPAPPAVDDYGRPIVAPSEPHLQPPTLDDVRHWIEPDPKMVYGSPAPEGHYLDPLKGGAPGQIAAGLFSPFARDPKTDETHLTLPPVFRNLLLGGLDVLQGRYQIGESGNPMTVRPTPNTTALATGAESGLRFGPTEAVPATWAFGEAPLTPEFKANPNLLGPEVAQRVTGTPSGEPVSPAPNPAPDTMFRPPTPTEPAPTSQTGVPFTPREPPPQPQGPPGSVGAQVTTEPIPPPTKAEELTNLQKSVLQSAVDRADREMSDDTTYIPGVRRPLTTREFTPQNALDDKVFRETDPAYRANAEKIDRENNDVMKDAILAHAGDQNSLAAAYDARRAVSPDQMGVFRNEQPISIEPLLSAIDEALASPAGRRGAVQKTLNNVRASLTRQGDDPTAMAPSQVYGARQNITDLLQKGATGAGDEAKDIQAAKALLTDLIPSFDSRIAAGAPKYSEYMSEFQRLSQTINQQEFLQKYLTGAGKLTNDQGMLLPNRVQKLLDDVYQGQSARGVNRANSLTPDAMNTIEGVRNELAYNVLRDRNAAVKGSDTFQKMNQAGILGTGPLGMAVKGGAEAAAHLVLAPLTAGVGNVLLSGFTRGMEARRAALETARLNTRKAQLLDQGPLPAP